MRPVLISTIVSLLLAGCARVPDYEPYRQAIRKRLLDPASAEFEHESIRTLWSKQGARLKIFCAMVNSNNQFGGKSGFHPATVIIGAKTTKPDALIEEIYRPGKVYIDDTQSISNYLKCVRPDTERQGDDMFVSFVLTDPWNEDKSPAEANAAMPVISTTEAPY